MGINLLGTIAILSIFFIQMGVGILTPALQNIMVAFPEIPFTTFMLVSTLPCLTMIVSSLATGAMAEKFGYRLINITAVALFVVGGTLPYIQNDFTMILVSRGIFGLGLGALFTMGNTLVIKFFEGQKRANLMGICGMSASIGGIALQMGGAFLCAISWRYTFLTHLVAVATLLLVIFFLPEPEKAPAMGSGSKTKLPAIVWILSLLAAFLQMINTPMLLNMSSLIINSKLGTAASAGIVLSMFTVGGMISGSLFGKMFKVFGRFIIAVGILAMAVGLGIDYYAGNLFMLGVGTTVIGVGLFTVFPACMMEFGMKVPPAGIAMASGIFMAMANVGLFLAPYYMALLVKIFGHTDVRFPLLAGSVILVITAMISIAVRVKPAPVPDVQN